MLKTLSLVLISSLPFLFSLNGDFVFDDSEAIIKNKDVTSESWLDAFYNDFWGMNIKSGLSHKSYRPLTILTFRLNYLLGGRLSVVHFKITNLLLHIFCCLLVRACFRQILFKYTNQTVDIAHMSTLLFAVHPIHIEAVSGVVGRADVLAANTFFLSFLLYNKAMSDSNWKYIYLIASVFIAGMSMLFKENGITVLGFCIIYDLLTKLTTNKHKTCTKAKASMIIRIIFILSSIMILLYGRWKVMGHKKPVFKAIDNPAAFADNFFTKIRTYNYIYFLNFLLLIWPQWLCYDWSMGCVPLVEDVLDYRNIWILLLYVYGILLLQAITLKNSNQTKRLIIIAVCLIIIPFLPASNIFYAVGFVIAERIVYIPSAGYCLLIGIGFNKLVNKRSELTCKVAKLFFLLLLVSYGLRSWQRSLDWHNEYNLFTSGLSVCPLNAKVHYNVAKVADATHRTDWALAEYKESIRLFPEYYQAMNNLANLLKNQKKYQEAELYLRAAIKHKQDFPAAWMNLGIVLANTKRYGESEIAYKAALKYREKYPDCLYNLGNLYLEMNDTESAMEKWFDAINLNSKHDLAWTNLMALLDNTGQINKALTIIPKVLAELPESPSVTFAIANIYGKINRYEEAEKYFKRSIKMFRSKVQAIHYANLGVLYHRWKKYTLAEEMYKNALKLDPRFKSAQKNLQNLHDLKN